jgi:hypothetical protein
MRYVISCPVLCATLLAMAPLVAGKEGPTAPSTDHIDVIAHIPLSGGPVVQLSSGTYWRRNYLYLGRGTGKAVTILDVTDPTAPKAAETLDLPKWQANENVSAVVGNAVLVTSSPSEPAPQTVTILSFADPEHPKVARQFSGVTSMLKDTSRGLVYLANSEGLWVLRLDPATDVDLDKEYQNYLLYYH